MKKLVLIFALLFINLTVFSQTIRRVNNTIGFNDPSIYATEQAAHDAAKDGDIIQLEPSDNPDYEDLTVIKRLTIVGIGYNLENTSNTFFDKRVPKLNVIQFNLGSTKSTIMGVEVLGGILLNTDNISVSRCKTSITLGMMYDSDKNLYSYANNVTIVRCLIGSISSYNWSSDRTYGNNCIISNNTIQGAIANLYNSVISNNILKSSNTCLYTSSGYIFSNNIIDARDDSQDFNVISPDDVTGTTVSNNLCTTFTGLPAGGGNVNKANATTIFKVANPWENFIDSNLQLADNSPAKTVGAGSTAIGAYAGGNPYIPSGVPAGPAITSFMSSGFGSSATPINITTSVRSNN